MRQNTFGSALDSTGEAYSALPVSPDLLAGFGGRQKKVCGSTLVHELSLYCAEIIVYYYITLRAPPGC